MLTPLEWEGAGTTIDHADGHVFVLDVAPSGAAAGPPLLVLHGFPTCSYDFAPVLDALAADRRVVLFDVPGFGLSSKPDHRYSIEGAADAAEAVIAHLGLTEVDLLTHDMGDTVGGELLARMVDGDLALAVRRRVLTNGSIYIGRAQLTAGQELLLSLPDERTELASPDMFATGLRGTLAPDSPVADEHLADLTALAERDGGLALLPRTIRYVEDRRANERRYTGAIETHPSPLHVVWGALDPVAVVEMAHTLVAARPDATLTVLDDVGHYPMLEAPDRFATAVLAGL